MEGGGPAGQGGFCLGPQASAIAPHSVGGGRVCSLCRLKQSRPEPANASLWADGTAALSLDPEMPRGD